MNSPNYKTKLLSLMESDKEDTEICTEESELKDYFTKSTIPGNSYPLFFLVKR